MVHILQILSRLVTLPYTVRYNYSVIMQALEEVGFVNVIAEDRSEQFVDVLQKELNRTLAIKDDFVRVRQLRLQNMLPTQVHF